ncbi:MAG: hypothetical protein HY043_15045 [Verrucomicrobia bacterium]|nr:hypothetical protein [Verrucomicrobiota bacterium]
MPYQNISAALSQEDKDAIRESLDTIRAKLSFLITLTTDERKQQKKMGPKSRGYLDNCLAAAVNNPNIIPPDFNVGEFGKDVKLWGDLEECLTGVQQLASEIEDTQMGVGNEALTAGNEVYAIVKNAAKRSPGLKPIAEQLGAQFAGQGNRKKGSSTTPSNLGKAA